MSKRYFVTGTHTDAGKTVVSAILTESLEADYWKPIQSGDLENSDTMKVQNLVSNAKSVFHKENYRLSYPMSPHISAQKDGVNISIDDFIMPETSNNLIVEGAGGLLVPINNHQFVIDLIKHLELEVILVSKHYLGSINHTLLSAQALDKYNIPVKGIIFNGTPQDGTEEIILAHTGYQCLGKINTENELNKAAIIKYKSTFQHLSN